MKLTRAMVRASREKMRTRRRRKGGGERIVEGNVNRLSQLLQSKDAELRLRVMICSVEVGLPKRWDGRRKLIFAEQDIVKGIVGTEKQMANEDAQAWPFWHKVGTRSVSAKISSCVSRCHLRYPGAATGAVFIGAEVTWSPEQLTNSPNLQSDWSYIGFKSHLLFPASVVGTLLLKKNKGGAWYLSKVPTQHR